MQELPTDFQTYIHQSKYARWRDDLGRRETWPETVQRYIDFWLGRGHITPEEGEYLGNEIRSLRVMPSMRALMTAGKALDRDAVAGYNCAFCHIDNPKKFDEILYILACGTGVGFSVERQFVVKLPEIPEEMYPTETVIKVSDSKIGWASALRELISLLYAGKVPSYDTSLVRPAGARLKVFGGRASGPLPLRELFDFTIQLFTNAKGRRLTSIECHSLVCKIAEIIVVGGVRRSALLSLGNLSDDRMRHAKDGQWWIENPHFALANNSVCYTEKPGIGIFMDEWKALYDSKSGERGIFNREAANKLIPQRRKEFGYKDWGSNPCFTGDMRLLTSKGYVRFDELALEECVTVATGDGGWSEGKVWGTGIKPIVIVEFLDGRKIKCTHNHLFLLGNGEECEASALSGKCVWQFNPLGKSAHQSYVCSVTPLGVEHVYDFNEPRTHWGVVEGCVVHNCSEIILRSAEFCNLSEVVVREDDTLDDLVSKVKTATILGTLQATITNFRYVSKEWKKNCEEERLLGVSLTGLSDHPVLNGSEGREELQGWLRVMKLEATVTNEDWADRMGINRAAAITCVKPSGCRPYNALLTTDGGILALGELDYSTDSQWLDVDIGGGEYGKITKTFRNGIAETVEIDLNFGMKLTSTPNHKWMVQSKGWVEAQDIMPSDQLVFNLGAYANSRNMPIIQPDTSLLYHNANKEVEIPKEMTKDLGWLLGYIWGDGAMCEGKSRFRFVDGNLAVLTKAKRIFKELFNLDGTIRELTDRKAHSMDIGSRMLWQMFEINGMVKQKTNSLEFIPQIIRKSSADVICAFLSGLVDSDGCVWVNPRSGAVVIITTSQEKLARHLQQVAMAVGLVFGISKLTKRRGAYAGSGPMYHLTLSWGQSTELREVLKRNSIKAHDKKFPVALNRSSRYKLGVVTTVKKSDAQATFDVETDQHWFWAGAFMSHNTVSSLVNSAAGMHARHSEYYIRTVRSDKKDPLGKLMKDAGIPCEDDVMKPDNTWVFSFPIKAPYGAVGRKDRTAIQQLELWKTYQLHWCEHKPSITVSVKEHEWLAVGAWCYENFDILSGVSFLPMSDHSYRQAPYQECTEEEYEAAVAAFPQIPWDKLSEYEKDDNTTSSQEMACTSGTCDIL